MAAADDAATVLEHFCQDVANLPAEIAHLLEEIQAKDMQILQCRDAITQRDNALQKHIRTAGSHVKHPKEDVFTKTIMTNFDRMEILQAEKLGLSDKAMIVLERQIKRFDIKLRDLQATDQFPLDPTLPSLLQPSSSNTVPPLSGVSTPLQSMSVNAAQGGGAPNIANAAVGRLGATGTARPAVAVIAQNPILAQPHLSSPVSRSSRENSAEISKRRRLTGNMSLTIPAQSSNLRQSSAGASTPKAGTPGATSRAGSAQPKPAIPAARKQPAGTKKVAPHQTVGAAAGRKRARSSLLPGKKGDRRRQLARERGRNSPSASPTPSTSHASTSPTPSSLPHGADGTAELQRKGRSGAATAAAADEDEAEAGNEGEEDDTQVYCTCQRPSFGDMVACDNEVCKFEWFHLECVGLKTAPTGDWLCPYCKQLPEKEIVRAQ